MTNEQMIAAEKLSEHLVEYLRSGMGTTKTTELIEPILAEMQELRQYFYGHLVKANNIQEANRG